MLVVAVTGSRESGKATLIRRFCNRCIPPEDVDLVDEVVPRTVVSANNGNMMKEATTLNEAQLSILRLLGSMKTIEEVDELRQVICDYYARRVDEEMDKLWESGQWDNEKNEAILKEHLRTPYKQ